MENTTKERSILDKSYLEIINEDLIGSAQCLAHSALALKHNSDKEKQEKLIAISNHYQNAHDWLENRLTQFEEMKTALEHINKSAYPFLTDEELRSFVEMAWILSNSVLASLTETKPSHEQEYKTALEKIAKLDYDESANINPADRLNKSAEIRFNDRDYKVGDIVYQQEFEPVQGYFIGREVLMKITYLLENYPALSSGFCMYCFEILERVECNESLKGKL